MLELLNVSKAFEDRKILDSFSYSFKPGIYVIKGESGIGKTTLLRIIAGLDNEYSGKVKGGGISNISFSFQEYRLFDHLNAIQNVSVIYEHPKDNDFRNAKNILSELGINESDQMLFPPQMSGGMKLRVSIARALCKDAPILLLDEPTREFNIEHTLKLARLLNQRKDKQIIIIVTHDDNVEKLCHYAEIIQL